MTEVDLTAILDAADEHVADELKNMPEVKDAGHDLDVNNLPVDDARVWHRVTEAAAVVFDLKGSTQLGLNQKAPSTASIYEAATGNAATILNEFDADFIAIQGDGGFGLFWGNIAVGELSVQGSPFRPSGRIRWRRSSSISGSRSRRLG